MWIKLFALPILALPLLIAACEPGPDDPAAPPATPEATPGTAPADPGAPADPAAPPPQ